ncbi:MAG: nucleotidyltransferase family protein [Acidobacteriota bacterium]
MNGMVLEAAAAVAEGGSGRRPAPVMTERDAERIVGILRRNKVPLLELSVDDCPPDLVAQGAWRDALAREERDRRELEVAFREVADRFARIGISPVLFKSGGTMPYLSSNLDTLVREGELIPAARALEDAGHLRLPHYREEHKLLFRKFQQGRSVISVHLHDAVSWGRVLILRGDDVTDRSRPSRAGPFRYPSIEDRIIALLAHCLYETDQIRLADLRTLRGCLRDADFAWERVLERVKQRGWWLGFCSILTITAALERSLYGSSCVPPTYLEMAGDTVARCAWAGWYVRRKVRALSTGPPASLPLPLSKVHSKAHFVERLARETTRTPDERLVDILATIGNLAANRLHLRCRPAVLISLSGLDGAGKSAATRAVESAMTLCEIPTRVVWNRGGFTGWLAAVKRASRAALPAVVPGPKDPQGKRRWLSHPVPGTSFAAVVLVEQLFLHLVRVVLARWVGTSIVCDRYSYDTAADLRTKLGRDAWSAATAGALLVGMTRRPDLAILLDLTPEQAVRRKPQDVLPGDVLTQYEALGDLGDRYGIRRVRSDRCEAEVIGEVVECALRAAFARFGRGRPAGPGE